MGWTPLASCATRQPSEPASPCAATSSAGPKPNSPPAAASTKTPVVAWETGKHYPKRKLGLLEEVLGVDLLTDQGATPFATPDEAAIWALDRFTENERRTLIRALRQARGQSAPVVSATPILPGPGPPAQLRGNLTRAFRCLDMGRGKPL